MQLLEGRLILSATDLSDFLACEHLASLKQRRAQGEDIPADRDAMSARLAEMGSEHERDCLSRYRAERSSVKMFDDSRTRDARSVAELETAAAETETAMRAGHDVIYQPFFLHQGWLGRADFLLRVDTPSALGGFSYEVADAKLARRVRAQALLQLCEYSHHVARIQGVQPALMHVLLGSGDTRSYPLNDFSAYHAAVRERLRDAVSLGFGSTYPERVSHCGVCQFSTLCDAKRRDDDHLSLVARARHDQIRRLQVAGVDTVAALARLDPAAEIPRIPEATLTSLREQARLQHAGPHPDGRPRHELLDMTEAGFGLCALPPPSPGDVFFDMEGDTLARDFPLEYLFGAVFSDDHGTRTYRSWEGHDPAAERRAFEEFIDWLMARRAAHADMHVYHYAAYERSALQRLMSRHGTRENEVDELLRGDVLVDLYRVVYQGIRLSTESYGLKDVERLYMPPREGAVASALSSLLMYEQWRASEDGTGQRDRALFDEIVRYNEVDCVSTAGLRDWLEQQRTAFERERGLRLPRPAEKPPRDDVRAAERTLAEEALRARLVDGIPEDPESRSAEQRAQWLVGQLVGYHNREAKSQWWHYYRRLELTQEQLADDRDALGPLTHLDTIEQGEKWRVDRYSFSPQEHHLGEKVIDPLRSNDAGQRGVAAGVVVDADDLRGILTLRRSTAEVDRGHPLFLVPSGPLRTDAQAGSLAAFGRAVLEQRLDAPDGWRSASDLLLRRAPLGEGVALQRHGESALDAGLRVLDTRDGACLAVQGPPGAGKTYTGARFAVQRAARGVVAVTALSHSAISNLLDEICAARERPEALRVGQLFKSEARCAAEDLICFKDNGHVLRTLDEEGVDVVGGTSWLFSRDDMVGRFDTLIVDEAGQMSLADVIAMSRCARNLVLLGDPRQLPQVVQGIHPDGADASALEHFLHQDRTMPADRGLFLDSTRRMCPPLCTFVSDAFYEGRLDADPSCAQQEILTDAGSLSGIRRCPVPHSGDRTSSESEADAVAGLVESLLDRTWRNQRGSLRRLSLADILVVAPYNAHVACLVRRLPEGTRVGTVDKFQGQEAAVSIFSMATSSTDDLPRNLEFLFSLNRLNVAISRARCLSIIVYSPELVRARCSTPGQMRLVNALCRFTREAAAWEHADARQLVLVP